MLHVFYATTTNLTVFVGVTLPYAMLFPFFFREDYRDRPFAWQMLVTGHGLCFLLLLTLSVSLWLLGGASPPLVALETLSAMPVVVAAKAMPLVSIGGSSVVSIAAAGNLSEFLLALETFLLIVLVSGIAAVLFVFRTRGGRIHFQRTDRRKSKRSFQDADLDSETLHECQLVGGPRVSDDDVAGRARISQVAPYQSRVLMQDRRISVMRSKSDSSTGQQ